MRGTSGRAPRWEITSARREASQLLRTSAMALRASARRGSLRRRGRRRRSCRPAPRPARRDLDDVVPVHDDRALLAARDRPDPRPAAHVGERLLERVDLEERADLRLVREHDIDVVLDQVQELGAEPVDAEAVGQGERGAATGPVGEVEGSLERRLGGGRVPQVALGVDDLGGGDQCLVDVVRDRGCRPRRGRCTWSAARRRSRAPGSAPSKGRRRR